MFHFAAKSTSCLTRFNTGLLQKVIVSEASAYSRVQVSHKLMSSCASGQMDKLNYAFLNFKGHPRGNLILHSLVTAGFIPKLVIEEDSKLAAKGTEILNSDLVQLDSQKYPMPPEMAEILASQGLKDTEFLSVKNHNVEKSLAAISHAGVDVVVLGDCRIMKPPIIQLAKRGMVNTHPGFLPEVRGNHCSLYAVLHDLPIGCTVHLVDQGVDTGPIILRERLGLPWTKLTYQELLWHLNVSCAGLAVDAMRQLEQSGAFIALEQHPEQLHDFGTFTAIDPVMKQQAITKLETGGYAGGSTIPMRQRGKYELTLSANEEPVAETKQE